MSCTVLGSDASSSQLCRCHKIFIPFFHVLVFCFAKVLERLFQVMDFLVMCGCSYKFQCSGVKRVKLIKECTPDIIQQFFCVCCFAYWCFDYIHMFLFGFVAHLSLITIV